MALKIVKMALKMVEMALKMVENHEYYTGNFDRRLLPFDRLSKMYRINRLLTFPVYFPEITRISESLIETHGLSRYAIKENGKTVEAENSTFWDEKTLHQKVRDKKMILLH